MVLKVPHIVVYDELKSYRVPVTDRAWSLPFDFRDPFDCMRQVQVHVCPDFHQFTPAPIAISLSFHPATLLITRKHKRFMHLCSDETLMVVRGGIDEMSQNLSPGPTPGSGVVETFLFAHSAQPKKISVKDLSELIG